MVGRSNVGKSSVINQLAGKKNKRTKEGARISQKPGCTQSINFYQYEPKIRLVDFPGFGYAKWPDSVRKKVNKLIEAYLFGRPQMACIIHLADIRVPLQKTDIYMMEMARNFNTPYLLSLNKCDKLSRLSIKKKVTELEELIRSYNYKFDILPVSAHTGQGLMDMKKKIRQIAEQFEISA